MEKLRQPNIMDRLKELSVSTRTEYNVTTTNGATLSHVVYSDRANPYLIYYNDRWISVNYDDFMEIVAAVEEIEKHKKEQQDA